MWITSSLATALKPTAVALGNFDGIHLGHRQVISPVLTPRQTPSGERLRPTVVTFSPHPQEFFTGQVRSLLTPLPEKVAQLRQMGIEQLVMLPFDRELAQLTPTEFVEIILLRELRAHRISVGADFRFGCRRSGTVDDLQAIAGQQGIEVTVAPLNLLDGQRVSSSVIRQALQQGNIEQANRWLGRPYSLVGQVIKGQQLGRTIGTPTANLEISPQKFLPCDGVYAVTVYRCETSDQLPYAREIALPGVMNLGLRPTVNGLGRTIEVHLLDWSGDLYGQLLQVNLQAFLRPEQKFASLDALQQQIQQDCEQARGQLQQQWHSSLNPDSCSP